MSLADNIRGHFKEKLSGDLQKITVPEWKTDVYFKATYSFATESKIISLQQQNKTVEALVEGIILKALNPEGKPMFNNGDRHMLMHEADPAVLLKVSSAINNAEEAEVDVVKN